MNATVVLLVLAWLLLNGLFLLAMWRYGKRYPPVEDDDPVEAGPKEPRKQARIDGSATISGQDVGT